MALVYQPRHKIKPIRYLPYHNFNHVSNTITKPTYNDTKPMHYLSKYTQKIIHALPNLFTTSKYTLTNYYKINKKKPKIKQYHGYHFINELALLKCGDIESDPRPNANPASNITQIEYHYLYKYKYMYQYQANY